jgi:Trk-type K+ transport system membrane component
LTEEQREELGGVEYRAVKTLLWILLVYFFGLTFFSWIALVPWIALDSQFGPVVDAAGVSRGWWGIFTGSSLFNDLGSLLRIPNTGYTLTNDSMISFQQAIWPLLIGSFFIIAGYLKLLNTNPETLASLVSSV